MYIGQKIWNPTYRWGIVVWYNEWYWCFFFIYTPLYHNTLLSPKISKLKKSKWFLQIKNPDTILYIYLELYEKLPLKWREGRTHNMRHEQSQRWSCTVLTLLEGAVRWLVVSVSVLESPPGDTLPQHNHPSTGTFLQSSAQCELPQR
jgi:hypothetical protein